MAEMKIVAFEIPIADLISKPKNTMRTGIMMPPPPSPPAFANSKAKIVMKKPAISIGKSGQIDLCIHTL